MRTSWAATLAAFVCRAILGVVSALGLLAVGPMAAGMHSTVVMSDSMAPGIRSGDVVVVRPVPADAVLVGKVVLADDPDVRGRLRLHRVAGFAPDGLVLKGDANAQQDAAHVSPAAVHGVGFLRVPLIGLPVFWLRTGHAWPAAVAVAGVLVAAAVVAVLDPPQGGGRPGRAARLLRNRRVRAGAAALGLLLAVVAAPHASAAPSSWAAFSGTTATSASMRTGTFACPALPSPTPDIAYSFTAASGAAEANRGGLGGTFSGTLTSDALRTVGTCNPGASPALRFSGSGSEAVTGPSGLSFAAQGTQTLWFRPVVATGVLAGLGTAGGADASGSNRQLYFTSAGKLAFAVRFGSTVASCTVSATVSLNAWHFAAVTYVPSTRTFTLYLDGTGNSCSRSSSDAPSGSGVLRLGSDATIAADAATAPYQGDLDELAAWGSVLTTTQIDAVRNNGH